MAQDVFLQPWRMPAPLHADEHVASMAVRMAGYGGMSIKDFASLYLDCPHSWLSDLPFRLEALQRLSSIAGHPIDAILWNAFSGTPDRPAMQTNKHYRFRERDIPTHRVTFGKRIAPGMLRDDGQEPYVRLAWAFRAFPCDLETGEVLLDRCPQCGGGLHWEAYRIEICITCRFDLREHPPVYWPTAALEGMRTVAGLMGLLGKEHDAPIPLPAPFDTLNAEDQIQALAWCAKLKGILERSSLPGWEGTAAEGLPIARAWPEPLNQLATLMARQVSQQDYDLQTVMADLIDDLKPLALRDAVLLQASDAMNRAIESNEIKASSQDPRRYLGLPDIKRLRRQTPRSSRRSVQSLFDQG